MSIWTHVAGIIRIDAWPGIDPEPDFDEIIGRECLYESDDIVWKEMSNHPDCFLPKGSEGTLQKSVWINPYPSAARYTVSVFGDLRDHYSPNEIIRWFEKVCKRINDLGYWIRNAIITAENELNGCRSWVLNREFEDVCVLDECDEEGEGREYD